MMTGSPNGGVTDSSCRVDCSLRVDLRSSGSTAAPIAGASVASISPGSSVRTVRDVPAPMRPPWPRQRLWWPRCTASGRLGRRRPDPSRRRPAYRSDRPDHAGLGARAHHARAARPKSAPDRGRPHSHTLPGGRGPRGRPQGSPASARPIDPDRPGRIERGRLFPSGRHVRAKNGIVPKNPVGPE